MPLRAVPALSWCGEVSLGGIHIIIIFRSSRHALLRMEYATGRRAIAHACMDACLYVYTYARRMGQPTQRAKNYTARSNIDTAQIFLHANGQRPKRAMIRQRSRRRQRRGEPHTEHSLGVTPYTHSHELPALTALAQHISHSRSGIDEKRPTEKFIYIYIYIHYIYIYMYIYVYTHTHTYIYIYIYICIHVYMYICI